MNYNSDYEFIKHLESSDNVYKEVLSVGNQATKLSQEYDNKLLFSDAITCILNGKLPQIDEVDDAEAEYEAIQIKELFCYINDKEIKDCVYDSFYESKAQHKLVYIYNDIKDESKQARIRVLTNKLWYKLIDKKK